MRGVGRAMDQSSDVTRAGETVEAVQGQIEALQAQFDAPVRGRGIQRPQRQLGARQLRGISSGGAVFAMVIARSARPSSKKRTA